MLNKIIMTPKHLRSNVRSHFGFDATEGKNVDKAMAVC